MFTLATLATLGLVKVNMRKKQITKSKKDYTRKKKYKVILRNIIDATLRQRNNMGLIEIFILSVIYFSLKQWEENNCRCKEEE